MKIPASAISVIAATMVLVGCTSDGDLDTRVLDQSWSDEWEKRWLCDGLVLYKSGLFGKVVFDGIDDEIFAYYSVNGLTQRWDWGVDDTASYRYSVVLEHGVSSLVARYYDFEYADEDGMAKSRATFLDCH